MSKATNVTCPKCGNIFNVEEVITHQLEEKYRADLSKQITEIENEYARKESALKKEGAKLKARADEIDKEIEDRVTQLADNQEKEISKRLKAKYDKELSQLNEEAETLRATAAENERLKRELKSQESKIKLELEKQMTDQLKSQAKDLEKSVGERYELKLIEKQTVIEQQKKEVEEMRRRLEQGSMQLQGEAQEILIENWLRENFPTDSIEEVKKGAFGADCLHTVHTRERQNCGCIYYESKRAKTFQNAWIEKFKSDMREKNAHVGVLVTATMPSHMERLGAMDEIWICSLEEFKGLSFVLRERVVAVSAAFAKQANKGDNMSAMYDYLVGEEFRRTVQGIVEGFTKFKSELDAERKWMTANWSKKEKHLEGILKNTAKMYGTLQSIAGNDLKVIESFEAPMLSSGNV